jgi:hypothetical protein
MSVHRRFRAPALLIAAFATLLVFAAAAGAETRTGETTVAVPLGVEAALPEATLVKSSASYDTTAGSVNFSITTAAEPQLQNEKGKPNETQLVVGLFDATGECGLGTLLAGAVSPPLFVAMSTYSQPTAAAGLLATSLDSLEPTGAALPVAKSVSGNTTTLALTSAEITNQGFNCALVEALAPVSLTPPVEGQPVATSGGDIMIFPIKVPPAPPAPPATPGPPPAPAPAPAPPALSIAKAKKPLSLKVGKSKTVKITLSNTGGSATAEGSLKVKAPTGVIVKPAKQKVPALAPGASWTVSVRVQLTEKAKKKSTLSLIGTAAGLTAKGSLVVKLKE